MIMGKHSIFNISSKSNINFTVSDGIKNVNFIHKKNPLPVARELIFCCEGRVRTSDLRVMSPTSYRCSTSRYKGAKITAASFLPKLYLSFLFYRGTTTYIQARYYRISFVANSAGTCSFCFQFPAYSYTYS